MVSQLLLLTLAADPTTATILVRRTAVPPAEATGVMNKVTQRLAVPGLMEFPESQRRLSALALKDGTTCGGKADCHAELGRQLGVAWLVLVSVSQIAQDQSLALELFNVGTEQVTERESLLLPKRGEVPAAMLDSFAARVTARVQPKVVEPPKPVDAPVVAVLVPPPPVEVKVPVLPPEPAPRSHAGGIVLGAAALAALGAGVGLLVNGLSTRAKVTNGMPGEDGRLRSELSGAQAKGLNDSASLQFGLAGGAGALGLALAATAIVAW